MGTIALVDGYLYPILSLPMAQQNPAAQKKPYRQYR